MKRRKKYGANRMEKGEVAGRRGGKAIAGLFSFCMPETIEVVDVFLVRVRVSSEAALCLSPCGRVASEG